jgi:hypothetical protein
MGTGAGSICYINSIRQALEWKRFIEKVLSHAGDRRGDLGGHHEAAGRKGFFELTGSRLEEHCGLSGAEHFQEKWEPVFRPKMRSTNTRPGPISRTPGPR